MNHPTMAAMTGVSRQVVGFVLNLLIIAFWTDAMTYLVRFVRVEIEFEVDMDVDNKGEDVGVNID